MEEQFPQLTLLWTYNIIRVFMQFYYNQYEIWLLKRNPLERHIYLNNLMYMYR